MSADPQKVFVIHGRNDGARKSMFAFLRAIGLRPIEWSEAMAATEKGSPYIGEVLDKAFEMAQAVVVLVTPDDIAHLRREYAAGDDDPEITPAGQARPNVLFEAGMAFGRNADRTIMVELGSLRPFSDVAGRHAVRLTNAPEKRIDLATRLNTAGCAVDTGGTDWLSEGDFTSPEPVGTAPPKGRRLAANEVVSAAGPRLDAKYLKRSAGSDRIQIINRTSKAILGIEALNAGDFTGRLDGFPIEKIPAYKSVSLHALRTMSSGNTFELKVQARTEDGIDFEEDLFLDLNG